MKHFTKHIFFTGEVMKKYLIALIFVLSSTQAFADGTILITTPGTGKWSKRVMQAELDVNGRELPFSLRKVPNLEKLEINKPLSVPAGDYFLSLSGLFRFSVKDNQQTEIKMVNVRPALEALFKPDVKSIWLFFDYSDKTVQSQILNYLYLDPYNKTACKYAGGCEFFEQAYQAGNLGILEGNIIRFNDPNNTTNRFDSYYTKYGTDWHKSQFPHVGSVSRGKEPKDFDFHVMPGVYGAMIYYKDKKKIPEFVYGIKL